MNKPILTIGIPTYNHAQALRVCLEAITAQFVDGDILNKVEIFISDNGDEGNLQKSVDEYHHDDGQKDDTRAIAGEYQKRFTNIRYSRNGKNIGFDRNVDAVLSNANGEFCWTLSSNEYLEPGSVAYVLATIQQHRDAAYLCVSNRKEDKKIDIRRFENGSQWLKEMGLFGGQISQCIFNVRYIPNDRAKYYDNVWFHLSLFWEIGAHHPIVLLPCLFRIPEKSEVCRWAQGGWGFRTYIYLKRIVVDLPRYGDDRRVVDGVVRGLAKGLPRNVASAKLYGLPVKWDRFSLLVREFYTYPLYLFLALCIFFTPGRILQLVKKYK